MDQLKYVLLISLLFQSSSFALSKDDKKKNTAAESHVEAAHPNDIVVPVALKTEKAGEVKAGAFSFTPSDASTQSKSISQLRADLLKLEEKLEYRKKQYNNKKAKYDFLGKSIFYALNNEALRRRDAIEAVDAQKVKIAEAARALAIKNQTQALDNATNPDEKARAEIALMNLRFNTDFLRKIKEANKKDQELPDEVLYEYINAVNNLSDSSRMIYIEKLSHKLQDQYLSTNISKLKLYLNGIKKIEEFKVLRQQEKEREIEEQSRIKTDKEVLVSTTERFVPETFAFFVASGAVTFNMMWIKSHGDPLEMERHIMSLKDPISHLSFYAFMQANGIFTNFHTSKASFQALDASTRKQMMVRLSYAGMAVGSLASSIVSDVGQSIVTCSQKWLQGKKDNASLESCDQAMKQWTLRKKTNQYFPQIISLFASQAATEVFENAAFRAFERMGVKTFAEKYLTRQALQGLAYRISAADVVLTCIPYAGEAKWVTKGFKFMGTVTKLSAFVAVDHILSSYINRPIENILKPSFFENKNVPNMNAAWFAADSINWDDAQAEKTARHKSVDEAITSNFSIIKGPTTGLPAIAPIKQAPVSIKESFPADIESYTEHMQEWRNHLNASAENDLSGWDEMTKKLLNQIDYSYQFYRKFTSEMFTTLNTQSEVSKKNLDVSAMSIISQYPLNRTLPFYGLNPGPLTKESALKFNDKYLSDPIEAEKFQRENILTVTQKYLDKKYVFNQTRHNENVLWNQILNQLISGQTQTMVSGLVQLRKIYNQISESNAPSYSSPTTLAPVGTYSGPIYHPIFQGLIIRLIGEIGYPMPIMDPLASFSQAVAAHSIFKGMDELADYSQWSLRKTYQFNKVSDLMIYKIICGDASASLNQVKVAGVHFLVPEFNPPGLLNSQANRGSFCKSIKNSDTMYYSKINNESATSFILKNINKEALGDIEKAQDTESFEKWWIKNAKMPMEKEFAGYDNLYKQAYLKFNDNFQGKGTWYEDLVDHLNTRTEYLPNSIKEVLKTESNVYLQLINRALINQKDVKLRLEKPTTKSEINRVVSKFVKGGLLSSVNSIGMIDYLAQSHEKMKNDKFTSFYDWERPEVTKLNALLNYYLTFLENSHTSPRFNQVTTADNTHAVTQKSWFQIRKEKEIRLQMQPNLQQLSKAEKADRFERYIAASKEIDKAINNILVSAGLKKLVKKADAHLTEDQKLQLAFGDFSGSGTENTEDVYEDLQIKNPTLRQKVVISAVKGIRQIESEMRRFIRMNSSLSSRLAIEDQEILSQMGSH